MPKGTAVATSTKRRIVNDFTEGSSYCYEDVGRLMDKYKLSYNTIYRALKDGGIRKVGKAPRGRPPKTPAKKEIETIPISPETTIIKVPYPVKRVVIRFENSEIIMEA